MKTLIHALALLVLVVAYCPLAACAPVDVDKERIQMRKEIERSARHAQRISGSGTVSEEILDVMTRVPRDRFVPRELRRDAYDNRPLPIGYGQTISQPYIVALMTDLADVDGESIVLEIGTGSGYQAAILGEIARQVYTIEIVEALGLRAAAVLEELGYDNVEVRVGDGYAGWPEHAPFDAIVVTAAPETVPQPLIDQLKTGGRMVIPVGGAGYQELKVLTKKDDGTVAVKDIIPVVFVPFTREER